MSLSIRLLLVLFLLSTAASAQDAAMLKRAYELGKQAEKAAQGGTLRFAEAEHLYQDALQLAPDDPMLNAGMGLCQLNGPQRHQALPYFMKAQAVAPDMPHVHFLTGYAQQLNGRWEEAIANFEKHKKTNPYNDPDPMYNTADKHIKECRNGMALKASPVKAEVANMGTGINSSFADYGPLVSADGKEMFYTSRRPTSTNSKVNKATLEHFEDIYAAHGAKGIWSEGQLLPAPVNTSQNDASVGLFNDGRTMVIYRDVNASGDMFESRRTGDVWSDPKAFGPTVNTPGHESSAWYSFDRQWLYFVSDRPDENLGGQDIYRSRWDASVNDWGVAENLGPTVNSPYDEDGIFVHPDGETIYFSSTGHNSMGGFDIFRSRLRNGQWTAPENLGWPVNSPDDDLFFVLTADGTLGYFSSFRADGLGEDDLYSVRFLPDVPDPDALLVVDAAGGVPVDATEPGTVMLAGRVKNLSDLGALDAHIELMDLGDAHLVASFDTDAATGEYLVTVPGGRDYAMYVKAPGFMFHSEHIHVPNGRTHASMNMDVTLQPVTAGSQGTMNNIFFASSSAALEQASLAELNQMHELLTGNAKIQIEISGHTDNTGSDALNDRLSRDRANAVREHLVKRGIDPKRLVAIGQGANKPVVPNDSETNKALNRRTEIKVL